MPLATTDDLLARLTPGTEVDADYAEALLDEASALVEAYLGRSFEASAIPQPVRLVVSRMAARIVLSPEEGMASSIQTTAGPFNRTISYNTGGGSVWLSASDKQMLAPFRKRRGGIYSLAFG